MEKSLTKLRVIDLKNLLTQAGVKTTQKTKADLIAHIIASPPAVALYQKQNAPKAQSEELDLLAPPEDVDWNEDSVPPGEPVLVSEEPVAAVTPTSIKASEPTSTDVATATSTAVLPPVTTTSTPTASTTTADDELEKRRKRAERFGVPLVEPKKPRTPAVVKPAAKITGTATPPTKPNAAPVAKPSAEDEEKLKARAARFSIGKPAATASTAQKRNAPADNVDAEELERRRKRAERFGAAPAAK